MVRGAGTIVRSNSEGRGSLPPPEAEISRPGLDEGVGARSPIERTFVLVLVDGAALAGLVRPTIARR